MSLPPPPPASPPPRVLPPPPSAFEAPPRRHHTLLPSLALLALLMAVVMGGYVSAGELGAGPPGPPVNVARGVRVHPASGWEVARRMSGDGYRIVRLTRGSGNLDVLVSGFEGDAKGLLDLYRRQALVPNSQRLRVSDRVEDVTLPSGLEGVRVSYFGEFGERGQAIEGEITAFVTASGTGVAFDGWAPQGNLQTILEDVHAMIERTEIR